MSGWYAPGHDRCAARRPGAPSRTTGATLGSTSAIASMDDWIPLPMAVRRPVVRLRIASTRRVRSVVGASMHRGEAAERDEADLRARGLASTKATAACWAASSRVGSMSVEHMLPDTSIARTIVDWLLGTRGRRSGRATATASAATAAATRTNGTWRRQRRLDGPAARMSDRLE